MDSDSRQASKLLNSIAESRERIIDLARHLRLHPEVTEVLHGIDLRNLQSGPTVEAYADVKLRSGKGVCWWLEINWDDNQWTIESRVTISDLNVDEGSKDLVRFPDKVAKTITEFVAQLEQATSELVNSVQSIDLAYSGNRYQSPRAT